MIAMSAECIELSSDEDVQIVDCTFIKDPNKARKAIKKTNNYIQPALTAVDKLSRNHAIELTINLEGNSPDEGSGLEEPKVEPSLSLNDKKKKTLENEGSSDIEIIELEDSTSDFPKTKEKPSRQRKPPPKQSTPPSRQKAILPKQNTPLPKETTLQPRANGSSNQSPSISPSKITNNFGSLSGEVVYVLDDDSDDDAQSNMSGIKIEKVASIANFSFNNSFNQSSPKTPKSASHTEKLVNSFREKISKKCSPTKQCSSSNQSPSHPLPKPSPSQSNGQCSKKKKRIAPEKATSSVDDNSELNPFRISTKNVDIDSLLSTSRATRRSSRCTQPVVDEFSVENNFGQLVKVCGKVFIHQNLEEKLWNNFKKASEPLLRSEEFICALKTALATVKNCDIDSLEGKLAIQRDVREVTKILKRHPVVVDRKVKKLSRMLQVIAGRIKKIEEMEVTSDEDNNQENAYILLDRYRTRAAKIYEKICELQNESPDAGRRVRQKLHFSGNSGYPQIEQALQKYYLKTKSFPDFVDVRKLVEKTVKDEKQDLTPQRITNIAQSIFVEFGSRLQRLRCYDDYMIMTEYVDESNAPSDPALEDNELSNKLDQLNSTKKIKEAENKIMEEFCNRQMKEKEDPEKHKSDDSASEEDDVSNHISEDESKKAETPGDLNISDTDEELMEDKRKRRKSESSDDDSETSPKSKSKRQDSDSSS